MKRIAILFLSAVLLLSFAACGQENLLSSPAFQPESTAGNDMERLAARGESDETETQSDAPSVQELPPMVRIRWQAGEFSAMLQLPESALDAFWDHAEDLLTEVDGQTGSAEDGGFDYLSSSPYYSGQEALLEDLLRFSGELPQRFYWINEDTVRAAWEIGVYLSVTCQDRVAHFDFSRTGEDGLQEPFDLFLAMIPEAELPDFDGNYWYRYIPEGEWQSVEEHPGFELLQVASEPVIKEKKLIDQLME